MSSFDSLIKFVSAPVGMQGVSLMLTVLSGYPLALIHRKYLYNNSRNFQYTFFVISGLLLMILNFGWHALHSVICILITWLVVTLVPGTILSVWMAYGCIMSYLIIGYWIFETDQYDLDWTTPFCVLTLKMIGLIMDVYDGCSEGKKDDYQKENPIAKDQLPSLLEVAAFGYYFGGFFVGPQFPLSRLRDFVDGKFLDPETKKPRESAPPAAIWRLVPGILYLASYMVLSSLLTAKFMYSEKFFRLNIFLKLLLCGIYFKVHMQKYTATWLINEGAMILSGFPYVPESDTWDGARDVNILKFELGMDFQSMIDSFNVNTNRWSGKYVFRRLKWLGNKNISQLATLFFLAVWHGYHLGYFLMFFFEFLCMKAQKDMVAIIKRLPSVESFLADSRVLPIKYLVCKTIVVVSTGFCALPFFLIKKERWIKSIASMYFSIWIFYGFVWPLLNLAILSFLKKEKKHKFEAQEIKKEE